MTTKILALTDALGNLVRFVLLPGQRFDTVGVAPLIKDIEFGGLIADKAFDSNWIIEEMNERGAQIGRCHVNRHLASLWAPTPEIMQRSSLAATVSSRRRGIGGVFGGRPDGVGR